MRKRKPLTRAQKFQIEARQLRNVNNGLLRNYAEQSYKLDQATDRIAWLEEQRKWDHLMLEHLVETAKWSAKKGVQSGLGRN